jgi:hypothetical protein
VYSISRLVNFTTRFDYVSSSDGSSLASTYKVDWVPTSKMSFFVSYSTTQSQFGDAKSSTDAVTANGRWQLNRALDISANYSFYHSSTQSTLLEVQLFNVTASARSQERPRERHPDLGRSAHAAVPAGCAKPQHFVHATYDFSVVKKVAVLPLENLTQDQLAGERVRKALVAELLAAGVVEVIEPGQVNRALNQANIQSVTNIGAEDFKKVGASLGVQAFFLGSLDVYDRINLGGGSFPR